MTEQGNAEVPDTYPNAHFPVDRNRRQPAAEVPGPWRSAPVRNVV